ncbi:farnesol dehydrogenase-like [Uranotaenia lowii]|uniref:farnesol dehydrogenase-like n=1 Tax=Uranotaenia lowii TaxID=190385 RepID=UPI00247B05C1|nr:farnesol dehydrogenase-like [Uranotaenia lowii]
MDRWIGRVAVVTGASSGIGAAIAKDFAKAGMICVGLARRVERIEALKDQLPAEARDRLHALKCDVSKEEDILGSFKWIEETFGGVDVLVNSAGVLRDTNIVDANNTQMLRELMDTNVMGLVLCSREAFQSMKKRNVDGHIVHINSTSGHYIIPFSQMNLYPASKYAVTAITEVMRHELRTAGTKVKVTSISPGWVRTEIVPEEYLNQSDLPMLDAADVSSAVLYAIGTPPHVQIQEIMMHPVGEEC